MHDNGQTQTGFTEAEKAELLSHLMRFTSEPLQVKRNLLASHGIRTRDEYLMPDTAHNYIKHPRLKLVLETRIDRGVVHGETGLGKTLAAKAFYNARLSEGFDKIAYINEKKILSKCDNRFESIEPFAMWLSDFHEVIIDEAFKTMNWDAVQPHCLSNYNTVIDMLYERQSRVLFFGHNHPRTIIKDASLLRRLIEVSGGVEVGPLLISECPKC